MSGVGSDIVPLSSVLDRLIDRSDAETSRRGQSIVELKHALRRDLENLLNTRAACGWDADDANDELSGSLANYGLPDFTAANLGDPVEQETLRRTIETTVRRFEPRLCDVRVALEPIPPSDRTLRFRIDAWLRIEPVPEPIRLETALEPTTATFVMKGGGA